MEVHVLRVKDDGRAHWVVFDRKHTLRGRVGEGQAKLLARWEKVYGKVTKLVTYDGPSRPSEAAMMILGLQYEAEEKKAIA